MIAAAREAMSEGLERWANPSSPHAEGRAARAALEDARARIKAALNWDHDVIFTSGASEAIQIGLGRSHADAVIVSAVEHDAIHRVQPKAYFLPVGGDGLVAVDALAGRLGALSAKRPLVAIQSVNNETGVIQPLGALIPKIREAGGIAFADCSQSAGKLPGIGALLIRDLGLIEPSGGQEKGYRSGTENQPAILGFAAALDANQGWVDRAADLRAHLDGAIKANGGEVVAGNSPRVATIASYHMPGLAASAQLIQFDMAGIAISAGSACSSGTLKSSRILAAMGWDDKAAGEVIRVSFGADTSRADVYRFVEAWKRIRA
jgi:cysteine desulfurase